jgi:5-methyltetrahydrofolate--homocysteine methyltransferase
LDLAKQIVDKEKFKRLKDVLQEKRASKLNTQEKPEAPLKIEAGNTRSAAVPIQTEVPSAPDYDRHIITNAPLDHIWNFVNPRMLYGRHLGVKGATVKLVEEQNWRALKADDAGKKVLEIIEAVNFLKKEWKKRDLKPKAVFQFYEAASEGNQLHLYSYVESEKLRRAPAEPKQSPKPVMTFDFPRQAKTNGLCLADYVSPLGSAIADNVCMFVVTAGDGIRKWSTQLKENGEYLKSHVLQALALETAEAFAEHLHSKIRGMWGFSDAPETTMMDRFQAKYRGKRYSFGYPACPVLDDQSKLFKLLSPQDIGVELTEGFMMDPEASVSALVFSNTACTYFGVGGS